MKKEKSIGLAVLALATLLAMGCQSPATSQNEDDPGPATVKGTVTLPASVTARPYSVVIDTNTNGDDGYTALAQGSITGTSFSYSVADVPAGNYYVYFVVNNSSATPTAPVGGDYYGMYGWGGSGNQPSGANAKVPARGSVTFDMSGITMPTGGSGGGVGSVSGTVTLSGPVAGKLYSVYLSTSPDTSEGYLAMSSDVVTGTTVTYSFTDIPSGSYYVSCVVAKTYPFLAPPFSGDDVAQGSVTVTGGANTTGNLTAISFVPTVSTATFTVALKNTSQEDFITISSVDPLLVDLYSISTAGVLSATPDATLTFTDPYSSAQTISNLPAGPYWAVSYSDQEDSGDFSIGDWLSGESTFVVAAPGGQQEWTLYPFPHNIGDQRVVSDTADLAKVLWVEYRWDEATYGAEPDTGNLTRVVTTNLTNVTLEDSWLTFPNDGEFTGQMMVPGMEGSGDYGVFLFIDVNNNETFDDGDQYFSSEDADFPALPADQIFADQNFQDIIDSVYAGNPATPQSFSYGGSLMTYIQPQ